MKENENLKKSCYSFLTRPNVVWLLYVSSSLLHVLGFSRKRALASIFPPQHKKSRITKDLHICQRFGAEEKEEEGEKARKSHLVTFQKFKLKLGLFFWLNFTEFQLHEQTSLDSFPSTSSPQVCPRISHETRSGGWRETLAIERSKARM